MTANLKLVAPQFGSDGRPGLDVGEKDLATVTPAAWDALVRANEPPRLFRYGNEPARLECRDGDWRLVPLTTDRLRHELANAAWCYTIKGVAPESATPPTSVIRDMLAMSDPPLPALDRVVTAPVFAPDGTIQLSSGYHHAGRTFCAPGLVIPTVPENPSDPDVAHARSLILDDLLVDFPFTSDAGRAHAIGLLLLVFARDLIPGPTPIHLFEAPTPGTGKTLLGRLMLIPAIGPNVAVTPETRNNDELRKRLTAELIEGSQAIIIDNVHGVINWGALAAALTVTKWRDRVLGFSRVIELPVRCAWVITANNAALTTEFARRAISIRLDTRMERPEERPVESFRHPEIEQWAVDHRGELVWSCLTLIQAWLAAGRPPPVCPPLGGFGGWRTVIGGILRHAGIPGFLGNRGELNRSADVGGRAWGALVGRWWKQFGSNVVGVAQLFGLVDDTDALGVRGENDHARRTSFGAQLRERRDRIIIGYCLTEARPRDGAVQWRLVPVGGNG